LVNFTLQLLNFCRTLGIGSNSISINLGVGALALDLFHAFALIFYFISLGGLIYGLLLFLLLFGNFFLNLS
jgi:hypothetical protein